MENKTPTGQVMVERTEKVKDRVKSILTQYPPCRGDDTLLIWRYWRRYCGLNIEFNDFQQLLRATSSETIRRRRQELQHDEYKRIEMGLQACHILTPSIRVKKKRERNFEAQSNYWGSNLKITDFIMRD